MERPNHVWCGDVTYLWSGAQWLYLALIIDLFSRRIVGWAISDSPDTTSKKALTIAYYPRG
ncbi:DDE-type integrase/transposase/recombinase [Sessilibacter corallicola]|uniref:DDE-type integrase/transposase/recombinase n=1 Tax=Sessilibacter corallicola TaxID=2904075 RepID=UPI003342C381